MSRKWNSIIKRLESQPIQDRLTRITDELVERSVFAPLRYEHMVPVVLKMIGTIYAKAYSSYNLTSTLYVRIAEDIYHRVDGFSQSEENKAIWNEIRLSMPGRLQEYWLGPDLERAQFFDGITIKNAEEFLNYLESESFDNMMKKIRRSKIVIPKIIL